MSTSFDAIASRACRSTKPLQSQEIRDVKEKLQDAEAQKDFEVERVRKETRKQTIHMVRLGGIGAVSDKCTLIDSSIPQFRCAQYLYRSSAPHKFVTFTQSCIIYMFASDEVCACLHVSIIWASYLL